MKNIFYKLIPALLFLISFSGCGGNPPCRQILPTTDFDINEYGCDMNYANMQQDLVYVINSEKEFENYFTCESSPQIDFSTKTLLVVYSTAPGGIENISTELVLENNIYSLKVDIVLNEMCIAGEPWRIAVIVEKIHPKNVILNININEIY